MPPLCREAYTLISCPLPVFKEVASHHVDGRSKSHPRAQESIKQNDILMSGGFPIFQSYKQCAIPILQTFGLVLMLCLRQIQIIIEG